MLHVATQLRHGNLISLPCMQTGVCGLKFLHADVLRLDDKPLYDQFCQKYREYAVQVSKDTWWCNTPYCDTIVQRSENDELATCTACSNQLCVKCGSVAHTGQVCSKALLNVKKCPSCVTPIEKIDGCNEIHCTRCNNYFCYSCGIDITQSLAVHY